MLHFLGRSPKPPAKEVFSRCRANTTTLYPSQLVKPTKQCDQKRATQCVFFVRDAVFLKIVKGLLQYELDWFILIKEYVSQTISMFLLRGFE